MINATIVPETQPYRMSPAQEAELAGVALEIAGLTSQFRAQVMRLADDIAELAVVTSRLARR